MNASSAAKRAVESTRRAWISGIVSVAVLAGGVAGLYAMQRWGKAVLVKPPAPLQQPLSALPSELPAVTWVDAKGVSHTAGPYRAIGPDQQLNAEVVAVLGTRDYLLRDYEDLSKQPDQVGRRVALNINYYSTGNATVHVPEVCWVGAGLVKYPNERSMMLANITHADGRTEPVPVRMQAFVPLARPGSEMIVTGTDPDRLDCVGYTFHVNGDYVELPAQVTKRFWDPEAKYAYHAKIEITVLGQTSEALAAPVIEGFMRASLASIERCLPDARALDEPVGPAPEAGSSAALKKPAGQNISVEAQSTALLARER